MLRFEFNYRDRRWKFERTPDGDMTWIWNVSKWVPCDLEELPAEVQKMVVHSLEQIK